jgi:hypothetical protein
MPDQDNLTSIHLRGPWVAVLADDHGYVYDSVEAALDEVSEDDWAYISVRRDTALPVPEDNVEGAALRLPGICKSGDEVFIISLYFGDDGDPATGCVAAFTTRMQTATADEVHAAELAWLAPGNLAAAHRAVLADAEARLANDHALAGGA